MKLLHPDRVDGVLDWPLHWFVLAVGSWTVVHQIGLRIGMSVDVAVPVWAVLVMVLLVLARQLPSASSVRTAVEWTRESARFAIAAGVLAMAAVGVIGLALATPGRHWLMFWSLASISLGFAVWVTVRLERNDFERIEIPRELSQASPVVLAAAALFTGLSLLVQRPDADDVYLVNRSTWVEQRGGEFPIRDTIFSDELFRDLRPSFPVTSIEVMIGALARWSPLSSPTATYLVFGPLVAGLSVLAVFRLLRTLGVARPVAATVIACIFLVLNGSMHASFGNMSFARSWQGKVALLTVLLPMISHYAIRVSRDSSMRNVLYLVLANIAAVGLSTTGVTTAPLATFLGLLVGLIVVKRSRMAFVGLAALVPPGILVVVRYLQAGRRGFGDIPTLLTSFVSADWSASRIDPAALWQFVFGSGFVTVVPTLSILGAWMFARDRTARVFLAVAPFFVVGLFYIPGSLSALNEFFPAEAVLWRMAWLLPVPVMFAVVVVGLWDLFDRLDRRVFRLALPAIMILTLTLNDAPVLRGDNISGFGTVSWNLSPSANLASQRLVGLLPDGGVIAAPVDISAGVVIRSSRVRAVNPRTVYAVWLSDEPEGRSSERQLLTHVLEHADEGVDQELLSYIFDALQVDAVCVPVILESDFVIGLLESRGFQEVLSDDVCRYWFSD